MVGHITHNSHCKRRTAQMIPPEGWGTKPFDRLRVTCHVETASVSTYYIFLMICVANSVVPTFVAPAICRSRS